MGWIIDFFAGLFNLIDAICNFVVWLFTEIVEFFQLAVQALLTAGSYIGQMPAIWIAPFTAIITIAIIVKVRG